MYLHNMCVHIYIYKHVIIHIHTHTYTYTHTHTYLYILSCSYLIYLVSFYPTAIHISFPQHNIHIFMHLVILFQTYFFFCSPLSYFQVFFLFFFCLFLLFLFASFHFLLLLSSVADGPRRLSLCEASGHRSYIYIYVYIYIYRYIHISIITVISICI